ncbi:MAG TPA: hypothetical protein VGF88_13220 [Acidobacteriaceae bacterium]
MSRKWTSLRNAIPYAVLLLLAASSAHDAPAQTSRPTTSISSIQLTPYTTPDKTAAAGVPSGWKVTEGTLTVIEMAGPKGETIYLGNAFIARNGTFQAGQRPAGGADLSMPYAASLAQKLAMILDQNAAIAGKPAPQLAVTSTTPLQVPAILGQCGRFVANLSGTAQGPGKIMGALCSLPLDYAGIYKNIMLMASAPVAVAAQDAPIASAVFASYKIPTNMLAMKLAPYTLPPLKRPAAGAPKTSTLSPQADTSAECFDLIVLRETPNRQLRKKCGGLAPNN